MIANLSNMCSLCFWKTCVKSVQILNALTFLFVVFWLFSAVYLDFLHCVFWILSYMYSNLSPLCILTFLHYLDFDKDYDDAECKLDGCWAHLPSSFNTSITLFPSVSNEHFTTAHYLQLLPAFYYHFDLLWLKKYTKVQFSSGQ